MSGDSIVDAITRYIQPSHPARPADEVRDEIQLSIQTSYDAFSPTIREELSKQFNRIKRMDYNAVLLISGSLEGCSNGNIPNFSDGTRYSSDFTEIYQAVDRFSDILKYREYHMILFTMCLQRWTKTTEHGGLGLDGSYPGLRAHSNGCVIM